MLIFFSLIQWAREEGLTDVAVLYSDTGWARASWAQRVEQMEVGYGGDACVLDVAALELSADFRLGW
jgi:hypothetical protein